MLEHGYGPPEHFARIWKPVAHKRASYVASVQVKRCRADIALAVPLDWSLTRDLSFCTSREPQNQIFDNPGVGMRFRVPLDVEPLVYLYSRSS